MEILKMLFVKEVGFLPDYGTKWRQGLQCVYQILQQSLQQLLRYATQKQKCT